MIFIARTWCEGGVFDCDSSKLRCDCPKLSLRESFMTAFERIFILWGFTHYSPFFMLTLIRHARRASHPYYKWHSL